MRAAENLFQHRKLLIEAGNWAFSASMLRRCAAMLSAIDAQLGAESVLGSGRAPGAKGSHSRILAKPSSPSVIPRS